MTYPTWYESFDHQALLRDYPLGTELQRRFAAMSADELRALQERRFQRVLERAWQLPFYRRLWGAVGIERGDIRSLDDIARLPTYSKSDLMRSVREHPPFGDFSGLDELPPEKRPPAVFHTTSGTTGTPQPLVFGPWSREVQNLLVARAYRFMGLAPGTVVQSCYGHGMINGGHYVREAVTRYTNALFLSAGTGLETRSVQQVQLMRAFGVRVLLGFADYIKKLAQVARDEGLEPGRDLAIDMIIGHLGMEDRAELGRAWGGARLFDWYGVGDTGCIAAEGPDQRGLYVWEDAHYLELTDVDSGAVLAEGAGNMVVTCLYKHDLYPIIRFNTCDVTAYETEAGEGLLPFKRIRGFLGRSDNMVKLRGINIYPHGIGAMLTSVPGFLGEYYCLARRAADGRDEMTVVAEAGAGADGKAFAAALRAGLGLAVEVRLVAAGATAAVTEIDRRQKPIRLRDER